VVTSGRQCLHMQHPSSLPPGHASELACAERLTKVTGFRRSNNLTTTPVDHDPQPRGRPPTSSRRFSFCQGSADWISEVPRLTLPQVYSKSSCVRLRYLHDPYTLLGSSNCMQPTRWSLRHHFILHCLAPLSTVFWSPIPHYMYVAQDRPGSWFCRGSDRPTQEL